jgi:DNA-binding response OmpR family regulator
MTESPATKNPSALIIEDHESVAEVFKAALERAEFEVEVIHDGRTALDRLATETPALVLLDLHLPFVSGTEILRYIRTEQRLAKTRVILTTADLLRAETLEHQADFVLTKPFGFMRLYEIAKELRASLA